MSKRGASTTSLVAAADPGFERWRRHKQQIDARTVTHWFTWRHLRCKVSLIPDYGSPGWTLLELHVIAARDTPCPLTDTGYLAHQLDTEQLAVAGGPVAFFQAWMDREAATKSYRAAEFQWRQGDLLDLLEIEDQDRAP